MLEREVNSNTFCGEKKKITILLTAAILVTGVNIEWNRTSASAKLSEKQFWELKWNQKDNELRPVHTDWKYKIYDSFS